jgi:hypothetical protein
VLARLLLVAILAVAVPVCRLVTHPESGEPVPLSQVTRQTTSAPTMRNVPNADVWLASRGRALSASAEVPGQATPLPDVSGVAKVP